MLVRSFLYNYFFFNDTATTEIYTLSLHDALPISMDDAVRRVAGEADLLLFDGTFWSDRELGAAAGGADRKSTRLNSSHLVISYAVFCLKKKKSYEFRCPKSYIATDSRTKRGNIVI